MDKRTFIAELEQSLSVLQEKELKDIIGEYEQHIDMKVQSGLSEEEAIADFGSLAELSAEILEAYHVRADYAAGANGKKEKKFSFAEGEKAGKEILQQTGEACVKTGKSTMRGLRRVGAWLWGVLLFWKVQIVRPFAWAGRKWTSYREERAEAEMDLQQTGEEPYMNIQDETMENPDAGSAAGAGAEQLFAGNPNRKNLNMHHSARHNSGRYNSDRHSSARRSRNLGAVVGKGCSSFIGMIAGLCRFCWKAFCWCVCVAWNLCWAGFFAVCGGTGLICLFLLGMMIVLLTQGYPLAGVTIGCLGLNLCLFAAAGFGMTMIKRLKKKTDVRKTEEDAYEKHQPVENYQLDENYQSDETCQAYEASQQYQEQEGKEHA